MPEKQLEPVVHACVTDAKRNTTHHFLVDPRKINWLYGFTYGKKSVWVVYFLPSFLSTYMNSVFFFFFFCLQVNTLSGGKNEWVSASVTFRQKSNWTLLRKDIVLFSKWVRLSSLSFTSAFFYIAFKNTSLFIHTHTHHVFPAWIWFPQFANMDKNCKRASNERN